MVHNNEIIRQAGGHPTPFYLYDMGLLRLTLDTLRSSVADRPDFRLHYALKANSNAPILSMIAEAGLGADTVSGGEIRMALDAGIPAADVVFAGVGKTDDEIRLALRAGIGMFNIESLEELAVVGGIAVSEGLTANVALRINPDIDAHTHHYITTGVAENKFGIDAHKAQDAVRAAVEMPGINFIGLHFHIGSQITDFQPYAVLCERALALVEEIEQHICPVPNINLGGGLGIDYDTPAANPVAPFDRFFAVFKKMLPQVAGRRYHFEPGRSIVAQCGSLIARALYVKQGSERRYVILDAGMTELIRPALYGALHHIDNVSAPADAPVENYDIVGPVCESTDIFAQNYPLPVTHRGDIIAIRSAGAYGEAMSMTYNARHLAPSLYL